MLLRALGILTIVSYLTRKGFNRLYEQFDTKVLSLKKDSISVESASFLVKIQAVNNSKIDATITEVQGVVSLDNKPFGVVDLKDESIYFQSGSTRLFQIGFKADTLSVIDRLQSLFAGNGVLQKPVRIEGFFRLANGLKIPFVDEKRIFA